ncbi:MAG: helix-turn-helix transcriptional regulator [Opitutaceae bacterium]
MVRLSSSTLLSAFAFLRELQEAGSLGELRGTIVTGLGKLIGCDGVNLNEAGLRSGTRQVVPTPRPPWWGRYGPVFCEHMMDHPLLNAEIGAKLCQPVTFSDCQGNDAWRKSPLYHEYFVPLGVRHQVATLILREGEKAVGIGLNRARRDFDAGERALLALLAPHLSFHYRLALTLNAANGNGDIGIGPSVEKLAGPSLTARERQVLHWIEEGKRNSEVATIMELSPRTVEKHLQNIFGKLGVETRTAAVRQAREFRMRAGRP